MSNLQDIFKRFAIEPLDNIFFSWNRIFQRFGIEDNINEETYKLTYKWVLPTFKQLYDFKLDGQENFPMEGPVVVCTNHQSLLDPILFGLACYHSGRIVYQMAKIELFETPIINAWIRFHSAFPVRRGTNDKLAFENAKKLLMEGKMVGIYPEGTLNPGGGRFLNPHTGAVRLAYETNSPILPMAHIGTDEIYPKGAKMPKFKGKIRVRFGKLMTYQDIFGKKSPDNPKFFEKASKKVMSRIQDMYFDLIDEKKKESKI